MQTLSRSHPLNWPIIGFPRLERRVGSQILGSHLEIVQINFSITNIFWSNFRQDFRVKVQILLQWSSSSLSEYYFVLDVGICLITFFSQNYRKCSLFLHGKNGRNSLWSGWFLFLNWKSWRNLTPLFHLGSFFGGIIASRETWLTLPIATSVCHCHPELQLSRLKELVDSRPKNFLGGVISQN